MTTKLERATPGPRTTSSSTPVASETSPARSAAVSAVAKTSTPARAQTTFGAAPAASALPLNPAGTPVTRSADPGALWGEAQAPSREAQLKSFQTLPPEQQAARLEQVRAEREEVGQAIATRCQTLDRGFRTLDPQTRAQLLHQLRREHHGRFDAVTGRKVDTLLARADGDQRRIDGLNKDLSHVHGRAKVSVERRAALKEQIAALRDAQVQTVDQATKAVDAAGLKVERLAVAEPVIDPNAPKAGSGQSLLDLVSKWVDLSWLFDGFSRVLQHVVSEQKDEEIDRQEVQQREDRALKNLADDQVKAELQAALRRSQS
jgi:hypothetical protein